MDKWKYPADFSEEEKKLFRDSAGFKSLGSDITGEDVYDRVDKLFVSWREKEVDPWLQKCLIEKTRLNNTIIALYLATIPEAKKAAVAVAYQNELTEEERNAINYEKEHRAQIAERWKNLPEDERMGNLFVRWWGQLSEQSQRGIRGAMLFPESVPLITRNFLNDFKGLTGETPVTDCYTTPFLQIGRVLEFPEENLQHELNRMPGKNPILLSDLCRKLEVKRMSRSHITRAVASLVSCLKKVAHKLTKSNRNDESDPESKALSFVMRVHKREGRVPTQKEIGKEVGYSRRTISRKLIGDPAEWDLLKNSLLYYKNSTQGYSVPNGEKIYSKDGNFTLEAFAEDDNEDY